MSDTQTEAKFRSDKEYLKGVSLMHAFDIKIVSIFTRMSLVANALESDVIFVSQTTKI